MRITYFNNDLKNKNDSEPQCLVAVSKSEAFRIIQHLLKQLEEPTALESFESNQGLTYFAVRPDKETLSK